MAFKLGKGTQPQALNGQVSKKLSFDRSGGDSDISVSDSVTRGNVPVIEVKEEEEETYDPGKGAPKPGKIYSPQQERVKAAMQSNPLSWLFT